MTRWQIDRTVAGQLLDATSHVLDDLSRWKIQGEEAFAGDPAQLRDVYGGVRWLRNYLQRRLSERPTEVRVDLDLTLADQNMLVSCALHEIAHCDVRMAESDLDAVGQNRLRAIQENMADWAVRLATRPAVRIPVPERLGMGSLKVQSVESSIKASLHPGPDLGAQSLPIAGGGEPLAIRSDLDTMFGGGFDSGAQWGTQGSAGALPFDPRRLRNPRLRSMATLDLRSFERSLAADDDRLAMLLLASVFEAAIVDFALGNQERLGLEGAPDTWPLERIVQPILGEDFGPMDRTVLAQIDAARDLNRPARQLGGPVSTPRPELDAARAFVHRVFQKLGLVVRRVDASR
jgi:hypothetical protein